MKDLLRRQLDRQFDQLHPLVEVERPSRGWIEAIRQALGMTLLQLGNRVGIKPQVLHKIEESEAAYSISLKTLQKVATAMNCRVFYCLIPEKSLEEMVELQIQKKAKKIVEAIAHSMSLEEQGIMEKETISQIQKVIDDIKRRKNISMIWDE